MRTLAYLKDQTFEMLEMRQLLGIDKEKSVETILAILSQVLFSQKKRRRDFADELMKRVRSARDEI